MRLRQPGEPKDDGRYKMERSVLFGKLRRKGIKIHPLGNDLYRLRKDFIIHIMRLKEVVPAGIVFRIAIKFSIQADKLYAE